MKTLLILVLLFFIGHVNAMEFEYSKRFPESADESSNVAQRAHFSGPIVRGDYNKFVEFVRRNPNDALHGLEKIDLDSSGGDVREAMLLANALTSLYPNMIVGSGSSCASACVLLWLSGAWHIAPDNGKIGLHRPIFASNYYKKLSIKDSQREYDKLSVNFLNFISKQGLPNSLSEKLMATSSDEIYWLSSKDISLIGLWPPYYAEKLIANCPKLDETMASMKAVNICEKRITYNERVNNIDKLINGSNDPTWEWVRTRSGLSKHNWVLVKESESMSKHFIDIDSIKMIDGQIRFWEKTEYPTALNMNGASYSSVKILILGNCKEQSSGRVGAVGYSENGNVVFSIPPPKIPEIRTFNSNDLGLVKLKFACKRIHS
jgi:ATP-dependent protease ClpP protease subunit